MRMRCKKTVKKIYNLLWKLGSISGCHQRKDRSFCFRGVQFPVCARCTGAFVGYLVGALWYLFDSFPIWLSLIFCLVLFVDWLMQHLCVLESDNIRRLITGILCGFGLTCICMEVMSMCANIIF